MDIEAEDYRNILTDKKIDFSKFSGKTVLITGANGMLPAYMAKTLLYLNTLNYFEPVKVICIVRNTEKAKKTFSKFISDKNLQFIEKDVTNSVDIDEPVDYIIHAASKASGKFFYSDPVGVINANTIGTYNMLKLAKEKDVKGFLYFSSGEACGDIYSRKDLIKETDYGVINPYDVRNCYAMSKKMGESMCYCWFYQYGIPAKSIRPSHTYGPGFKTDDDRSFAQFVMNAINEEDIILASDGSAKRSFVYISDATRAYFNVLLNGKNGEVYNVSNKREISILELANTIAKITNNKIKVTHKDNVINQSSKSTHGRADIEKIQTLGWEPLISEEEGFKRTILFYQNQTKFQS